MKKLLSIIAVAALATGAFAASEVNFGGSLDFDATHISNDIAGLDYNGSYTDSEVNLWATTDLADNVSAKINLKYKKDFGGVGITNIGALVGVDAPTYVGDIVLWEGYVKLAKMYDTPVDFVAGRWVQGYGEGFIVPDNVPVDGFKLTWDADPSYVDFFYWKKLEAFPTQEDDYTVLGAYASTKAIECVTLDAYVLYADVQAFDAHGLWIGVRANGTVPAVEGLAYKAELAYNNIDNDITADTLSDVAGYVGVAYTFNQSEYKPFIGANFYYIGDEFIQPFGHNDQDDLGEKGYGRIADGFSLLRNNVMFLNLNAGFKPAEKWAADADFYYYLATDEDGLILNLADKELGWEADVRVSYQYSENVAAELIAGYFDADDNIGGGEAWLVKGGMKVSF